MSFTTLLNLIKTRIDGSADFWTEKNLPAITEVIPWEGGLNYDEERDDPQPPRPYIALDFGDLPREYTEGFKEGTMDFDLVVVVDNFHTGRSRSRDRADYLEVLSYADAVEQLFEGWEQIRVTTFRKPVYQGNLCIHRLACTRRFRDTRNRAPWTVTV
jgi:hypothetical protein